MNSLSDRIRFRIETLKLEIKAALGAIAKEESIARKERRPVPRALLDEMNERVVQARREVASAEAAAAGASRFPPIGS